MAQSVLEEAVLDFYGFTKMVMLNRQPKELFILANSALHLPYEVPVYWVFIRVDKGRYAFDRVEERPKT